MNSRPNTGSSNSAVSSRAANPTINSVAVSWLSIVATATVLILVGCESNPGTSVKQHSRHKPEVTPTNQHIAEQIYKRSRAVVYSEFEVELNDVLIKDLHNYLHGTDFEEYPTANDFVVLSRKLNSYRSHRTRAEIRNHVKNATSENVGTAVKAIAEVNNLGYAKANAGVERHVDVENLIEQVKSKTYEIEGNLNPNDLAELRETVSLAYVRLLKTLESDGFEAPIDPKQLYGLWEISISPDRYEHQLSPDGSLRSEIFSKTPEKLPGGGWVKVSTGKWTLKGRDLKLAAEYVWAGPVYQQHNQTFIERPIVYYDESLVVFSDGTTMSKKQ